MTRRFVPTLAFAIPLLGLAGCDGKPDEDLPPAARRQAPPAETPSEKPATEEPPKKKLTEVRMDPVPAPTAAQFRKGVPARPGMSPDELRAYAEAQGDPEAGDFTMEEALAGAPELADRSRGPLMATFETTLGSFTCELYEDKAPLTVANFVGLARGLRASYDPASDSWVKKNFYDGVLFHRVIEGFMVQTGDPTGTGMGGPGYVIVDEFAQDLRHRGPGILSMANRGPNTGSSQFFITVADTPHLDGRHAIFGQCAPEVPIAISRVPNDARRGNRPLEDVKIVGIAIHRKSDAPGTSAKEAAPSTHEAGDAGASATADASKAETAKAPAEAPKAKPEPAKTEPAKTEPAKTDGSKPEPAKTEPAKTAPAKTEAAKTEAAKTEAAPADAG